MNMVGHITTQHGNVFKYPFFSFRVINYLFSSVLFPLFHSFYFDAIMNLRPVFNSLI